MENFNLDVDHAIGQQEKRFMLIALLLGVEIKGLEEKKEILLEIINRLEDALFVRKGIV